MFLSRNQCYRNSVFAGVCVHQAVSYDKVAFFLLFCLQYLYSLAVTTPFLVDDCEIQVWLYAWETRWTMRIIGLLICKTWQYYSFLNRVLALKKLQKFLSEMAPILWLPHPRPLSGWSFVVSCLVVLPCCCGLVLFSVSSPILFLYLQKRNHLQIMYAHTFSWH